MRSGDTPVPIPNTLVKTCPADGTTLETMWESRWPPDLNKRIVTVLDYLESFGDSLRAVKRLDIG